MFQRIAIAIGLLALIAVAAAAYLLRAPEEASAPIEAIPLELEATAEVAEAEPVEEPAAEPESQATTEAETTEEVVVEEPAPPTAEPTAAPTAEPTAEGFALTIFTIDQEQSQVRFELDEDLRGQRITVVGTSNQVAGELAVDLDDLADTQVGVLQINARTLQTDSGNRNRAINNFILDTSTYEFITFEPTALNNLPDTAVIGEAVTFEIVGNLTIRDVTQEVVFSVSATPVSETELNGTASTVITLAQYGLSIPSVPAVANVEEEVELYIDFVALAS